MPINAPAAPVVEVSATDRQTLQDFANGTTSLTNAQLTAIMRVAARYLLAVVDEVVFARKVLKK